MHTLILIISVIHYVHEYLHVAVRLAKINTLKTHKSLLSAVLQYTPHIILVIVKMILP